MSIIVDQVARSFGDTTALHPTSLSIKQGELVGLLGPSGSGKTTLLRIIAGLEQPTAGRILFGDQDITRVHVSRRHIGFVFQHYALFRHMTVFENIAFGLRIQPRSQRLSRSAITARVQELLETIQLSHLAKRLPAQLSGGQQQRVALARALATEPKVLLMDEPFGALDTQVRVEMRRWLRALHERLKFTCLFVTHDQEEALELSDRVAVMSHGRIEQIDDPATLYQSPQNAFVFNFLGESNVLEGRWDNGQLIQGEAVFTTDTPATLLIRPHDLALSRQPPSKHVHLPVTVHDVVSLGAQVRIELRAPWLAHSWYALLLHHEAEQQHFVQGEHLFAIPRRVFNAAHP